MNVSKNKEVNKVKERYKTIDYLRVFQLIVVLTELVFDTEKGLNPSLSYQRTYYQKMTTPIRTPEVEPSLLNTIILYPTTIYSSYWSTVVLRFVV